MALLTAILAASACFNISGLYQRKGLALLVRYEQKNCEEITISYPSGNFIQEPIQLLVDGQIHWVYDSYKSYKFINNVFYINAFYQKQGVLYEGRVKQLSNGNLLWHSKWIYPDGKSVERIDEEIKLEEPWL